jgi:hypothetical protein
MIIFGSVFIKKNNQTEFFLKKNRNRTETGSNRPVSVRFSFLGKKPVQTGLARFSGFGSVFLVLARFFQFGSVFPVWLGFGSVFFRFFVGFSSVRFDFFFIKPKPNRTGRFF